MMLLSSRATRAGVVLAAVALTACNDDSNLTQAPQHARRDVVGGTVRLVTNASGGSVAGSLRAVINQTVGGETIHFDASLAGAKITLDTTLDVPQGVTIEGPIDKGITISGGGKSTVMVVHRGATLVNLTITEGQATANNPAGGILDTGVLIVKNSTIAGNHGVDGAGIRGDFVALFNSTVTNNSVSQNPVPVVLGLGSNPARNAATPVPDGTGAAGIAYSFSGALTLDNSAVSNNAGGGGIHPFGTGNTPVVHLRNAIISNNEIGSCVGGTLGFIYEGLSISSDKSCGTPALHMLVADPLLDDLADNGGPTQTRALDRNSPAIDATDCDVTVDQRYVPRDAKCDIGPFEFVPTKIAVTIDPTVRVDPQTGSAVVTGTMRCTREEQFNLAIDLQQDEKAHRAPIVVDATQPIAVTCGTTAQPWIALITPPAGEAFENGDAVASAQTVDIAKGVVPSSVSTVVGLARAKK